MKYILKITDSNGLSWEIFSSIRAAKRARTQAVRESVPKGKGFKRADYISALGNDTIRFTHPIYSNILFVIERNGYQ